MDYHAPTDCATIKKWLTKCADDSETANYISAHTKDVSDMNNDLQCYRKHLIVKLFFSVQNVISV